jgi:hypothetical protein
MLTNARLVILIVLFAVVVAAFATFALLPRRYQIREQLTGMDVFWHEDEAFVFVDHHAMVRSTNAALERLPQSGWWASLATISADWRGLGQTTSAYRLSGGVLDRYDLPNTVMAPSWDLEDGRLVARARIPAEEGQGFRWTGNGFGRLPAGATAAMPSPGARTLQSDDQDEDEDQARGFGPIPTEARERLKNAGWHFKHLSGYEGIRGPVVLPIALCSGTSTLSLRSEERAEFLLPFTTTLELAGDRLSPHAQILFQDAGWKEIPRADFEARSAGAVRPSSFPTSMLVLLVLWLGVLVLKVSGVAGGFLPFLGLRRRLVKSVATTMSFPSAIPEQFPRLDRPRLEAFSRDLEGLGFAKLLDTAPVADSPTHPPSFCRIYAHRRQACFGVIMQSFPAIGRPIDLRCMLNGYLDDGWSVGASNGQPLAASAFVRRPRAIGVSLPEAPPAELLARFLQFRDRVCADLGLRPITDTSLETYIRRTLESLAEIREAMKKRSLAVGLGQYYSRKLGLRRQKSQLVWLGDYPKSAEERKAAGLGPGFSGATMFE